MLACYECEHRQRSLGNEAYHIRTTPTVWHPLTYSSGRGRQLFVFVTLESAIHIVLGDNLQFIFMVYGTTPYVVMALKKGLPFKCVQNDMFRT